MAEQRWHGLESTLEAILNTEYYGNLSESDSEIEADEATSVPVQPSDEEYDAEIDIERRILTELGEEKEGSSSITSSSAVVVVLLVVMCLFFVCGNNNNNIYGTSSCCNNKITLSTTVTNQQ